MYYLYILHTCAMPIGIHAILMHERYKKNYVTRIIAKVRYIKYVAYTYVLHTISLHKGNSEFGTLQLCLIMRSKSLPTTNVEI